MHFVTPTVAALMLLGRAVADPLWIVYFYKDSAQCQGDDVGSISGFNGSNVECQSTSSQPHDIKTQGIVEAGKEVLLFSDNACGKGVTGMIDTDGCQVTPESAPVAAITVRDKQ